LEQITIIGRDSTLSTVAEERPSSPSLILAGGLRGIFLRCPKRLFNVFQIGLLSDGLGLDKCGKEPYDADVQGE